MKILIDADGCPVVKETINTAKENKIEVVVFCDTSHIISSDYAKTLGNKEKSEPWLKLADLPLLCVKNTRNTLSIPAFLCLD